MPISKSKTPSAQAGETYRAGCPSLGARLLAAASLVRPGSVVADIGCDHGKLAVYLALKQDAQVIAVDVRPLPLARAKGLVRQNNLQTRVDCRLGNGLEALRPGEAADIVIAGMSGQTMIEILEACPWANSPEMHFILVPTTRHYQLRQWLCQRGYKILQELPVEENGRYYTVLSVGWSGDGFEPSALFCTVGLLENMQCPAAAGYKKRRLEHLRKKARASLSSQERAALEALTEEVEKCLN